MLPEDRRHYLANLAAQLLSVSSALNASMHPVLRKTLGELVRSMNCYYSNLIENHPTHPRDINRALAGDYANEPHKRNLQLEAVAHIQVQRMIEEGKAPRPSTSIDFLTWVHREFCARLPEELLWVKNLDTGEKQRVIPGAFREGYVQVGIHFSPPPSEIAGMLARIHEAYSGPNIGTLGRIVASGAAHHRLLWVHPFLDGNGRVARLFSHAYLLEAGVGCELWSISRGLARSRERYKELLQEADEPRRGDLDGRGALSAQGLERFCTYFLETCLDQVDFMGRLMEPPALLTRIEIWCEEMQRGGKLPPGVWPLLREAVIMGELPRGKAPSITGYQERQARKVLSTLVASGVLVSDTPLGPVRLAFPDSVAERWLPSLYPAQG